MYTKKCWICLFAALLAFCIIPVGVSAADKMIKIGGLYPMTGRAGLYGKDSVAAAEIAINEINAKGGVAGYKIDATFNDSKVKAAYAIRVAKRY
ncbi:MAG: ABC transporter substrate-binding protein, partial [Desulfobacula sp.]|nr:ABC transporter substrate-binding protein [Desulfobacula sp.]